MAKTQEEWSPTRRWLGNGEGRRNCIRQYYRTCSGTTCRGFVTSGVIDDFVGVGLRESSISELGIAGTKINTDLPRFGPLNVR